MKNFTLTIVFFIIIMGLSAQFSNHWPSRQVLKQGVNGNYTENIVSSYSFQQIICMQGTDTLYMSFDLSDPGVTIVGPFYAYNDYFMEWITPKLGYIILNGDHNFNIITGWRDSTFTTSSQVLKENVSFSNNDTLSFNSTDAIYELIFDPIDPDGNHFKNLSGKTESDFYIIIPQEKGCWAAQNFYLFEGKAYLSSMSTDIQVVCSSLYTDIENQNDSYYVEFPALHGVGGNVFLTNDSDEYTFLSFQMFASYEQYNYCGAGIGKGILHPTNSGFFGGTIGVYVVPIQPDKYWNGSLYTINQDYDRVRLAVGPYYATGLDYQNAVECWVHNIETINDSLAAFNSLEPPFNVFKVGEGDTMFFGESPITHVVQWANNMPGGVILAGLKTLGQLEEDLRSSFDPPHFLITDSLGNVIGSGGGYQIYYHNLPPGKYSVEIKSENCPFYDGEGYSILNTAFTSGAVDASPPAINPIQFRNAENQVVISVDKGTQLNMLFSAADFNDVNHDITMSYYEMEYQSVIDDSTRVFIREHGESLWHETDVVNLYEDSVAGISYMADLLAFTNTDSAALDVMVMIQDSIGNTAVYTIVPAILVEDISTGVEDQFPEESKFEFTLYPNPASSVITIETSLVTDNNTFVTLHNISGKLILHQQITEKQTSIDMSGLPKGIYFVKMSNDQMMHVEKIIKQ